MSKRFPTSYYLWEVRKFMSAIKNVRQTETVDRRPRVLVGILSSIRHATPRRLRQRQIILSFFLWNFGKLTGSRPLRLYESMLGF